MYNLKDKVVVITGASSGIGRAMALEFAAQGSQVLLASRNLERLEDVKKECQKFNVKAELVQCDVSIKEDCQKLALKSEEIFGRTDVLINNAGISMRSLFSEMDPDVFKQVMDINFMGTVYCTRFLIPEIIKRKGWVLGVSSIAGYRGLPGRTAYSASKFAMNGFLESLRTENLKTGLNVLTVCPGFTASEIRKRALTGDGSTQAESPREEQKMMQPEEVAQFTIKAMKQGKKQLILTRQGKLTVLMNRFFNSMMDKIVFNHMSKEPGSPF